MARRCLYDIQNVYTSSEGMRHRQSQMDATTLKAAERKAARGMKRRKYALADEVAIVQRCAGVSVRQDQDRGLQRGGRVVSRCRVMKQKGRKIVVCRRMKSKVGWRKISGVK